MMTFVGIDPGISGGFAVLNAHGRVLATWKMPETLDGLKAIMRDLIDLKPNLRVTLEYVRSRPGMSSVATFTFGRGYGHLEAALTMAGIGFTTVTPKQWQTALACRTGGDKNITKAAASRLFPDVQMTHAIADALLLAEFGRRRAMTTLRVRRPR